MIIVFLMSTAWKNVQQVAIMRVIGIPVIVLVLMVLILVSVQILSLKVPHFGVGLKLLMACTRSIKACHSAKTVLLENTVLVARVHVPIVQLGKCLPQVLQLATFVKVIMSIRTKKDRQLAKAVRVVVVHRIITIHVLDGKFLVGLFILKFANNMNYNFRVYSKTRI